MRNRTRTITLRFYFFHTTVFINFEPQWERPQLYAHAAGTEYAVLAGRLQVFVTKGAPGH